MFGANRVSPERTARVRQIKAWAEEALGLQGSAVVMVTELRCTEPGCPPLETVIAVMDAGAGAEPRRFKIHKAVDAVVREDVEAAVKRLADHEARNHDAAPDTTR